MTEKRVAIFWDLGRRPLSMIVSLIQKVYRELSFFFWYPWTENHYQHPEHSTWIWENHLIQGIHWDYPAWYAFTLPLPVLWSLDYRLPPQREEGGCGPDDAWFVYLQIAMSIWQKYVNAVDVMAYAMDNCPPHTIILITGDRDFAYLVSILTLRQYHVVVIVPSNHHSSLTYQASAVLDWNTQILQQPSKFTSAMMSNFVPPSPLQPFSFPNTFPVSSSKQAPGIVTLVPPVMFSHTQQSPQNQMERTISVNLLPP